MKTNSLSGWLALQVDVFSHVNLQWAKKVQCPNVMPNFAVPSEVKCLVLLLEANIP